MSTAAVQCPNKSIGRLTILRHLSYEYIPKLSCTILIFLYWETKWTLAFDFAWMKYSQINRSEKNSPGLQSTAVKKYKGSICILYMIEFKWLTDRCSLTWSSFAYFHMLKWEVKQGVHSSLRRRLSRKPFLSQKNVDIRLLTFEWESVGLSNLVGVVRWGTLKQLRVKSPA